MHISSAVSNASCKSAVRLCCATVCCTQLSQATAANEVHNVGSTISACKKQKNTPTWGKAFMCHESERHESRAEHYPPFYLCPMMQPGCGQLVFSCGTKIAMSSSGAAAACDCCCCRACRLASISRLRALGRFFSLLGSPWACWHGPGGHFLDWSWQRAFNFRLGRFYPVVCLQYAELLKERMNIVNLQHDHIPKASQVGSSSWKRIINILFNVLKAQFLELLKLLVDEEVGLANCCSYPALHVLREGCLVQVTLGVFDVALEDLLCARQGGKERVALPHGQV
uniref:Uncharacterized protein n=1 Tax=Rhipicephalus pulchellus TaxID=72859 RepID=L7LVS9_RHIPC